MKLRLVNPSPDRHLAGLFEGNKRGKNMKRRHHGIAVRAGKRRSHGALIRLRKNPFNVQTIKKVALSSLGAGAIAGATAIAMHEGAARIPFLAQHGITGYKFAALEAGLGIAASLALQSFGLDTVAAGIGVGGVVSGLLDAYATYKAPAPAGAVYVPSSRLAPGQSPAPQYNNCYQFSAAR